MTVGPHQVTLRGGLKLGARLPAIRRVPPPPVRPPGPVAQPVVLPSFVGASVKEIARLVRLVRIWFVVDDSGSMYARWGDPLGVRYAAAQSLLRLMRRSGGGMASVIHWGTEAPAEMVTPLTDVRRGRKALNTALTIPVPTLGENDLPAALRRTREGMPEADEQHVDIVVAITDGIEYVGPAMHDAVAALPKGCVHMLLVDRSHGCDAAMERDWRSVAFGSFTRLDTFDTHGMAHQIATTFAHAVGLDLPAKTNH